MEELRLRLGFAAEKLHVVNQERIDAAQAVGKRLLRLAGERGEEFIDVLFGIHIHHRGAAVAAQCVASGVHQVRFAEAGTAVDEQRVAVGEEMPAGDALGGGEGFVVGRGGDEVMKLVVAVKVAFKRRGRGVALGGRGTGKQLRRGGDFQLYFFDALVA